MCAEITSKLDPYWKLQLVVRTENVELRSETFPFKDQNFSSLKQENHEFEQQ